LLLSLAGDGSQAQTPSLGVTNARQIVGEPKRPALGGAALEAETKRVALLLRCPVCQGLSVFESPSSMALNMREQVRELVAAGYDEEQVLRYFERSYGEFVRLEPPLRGVNWLVWLAPIAGLLLGGIVVTLALRKPKTAPAAGTPAALEDDPELLPYLLRVRQLAYGSAAAVGTEEPKP
jgi:cytochrome c-type biogenesis protein CcmH/NrfF